VEYGSCITWSKQASREGWLPLAWTSDREVAVECSYRLPRRLLIAGANWTEENSVYFPLHISNIGTWRTYRSIASRSRDSSVGKANAYMLDGRIASPGNDESCLLCMSPRPALGSTYRHIKWILGAILWGVKWPEREADHSPVTIQNTVHVLWINLYTLSKL
jgi:hypothetical protein